MTVVLVFAASMQWHQCHVGQKSPYTSSPSAVHSGSLRGARRTKSSGQAYSPEVKLVKVSQTVNLSCCWKMRTYVIDIRRITAYP